MTGFGRGEFESNSYGFKAEVKTVNHRYSDISIRMPRYLNFLEENIKKEVKKIIRRGRVDVYISLDYLDESSLNIDLDLGLARELNKNLNVLRDDLGIEGKISVDNILNLADIVKIERQILDEDEIWEGIRLALNNALEDIMTMKKLEGANLQSDMLEKLKLIGTKLGEITSRSPRVVVEYKHKLEARINEILNDASLVDMEKLAEEVAFFADKSNIDEEIIRLNSHLDQYIVIMEEVEPVGRKLDFLIQEMNREINTIGSKSGDVEITKNVVDIKSEIEKLREQVQNIE